MLFKNENPVLGAGTKLTEFSGYGAGQPKSNAFKPTTRETLAIQIPATLTSEYVFEAPWKCQVVAMHLNWTVQSTGASNLSVEKVTADGVAPAAANGTTLVLLTSAVVSLQGTANSRKELTLSTAAGSPLVLNAGDQIALFVSAAPAGLVGANLQIDIAQIG